MHTDERLINVSSAEPLVGPGYSYAKVTETVAAPILTVPTPRGWFITFGVAFLLVMVFLAAVTYLFMRGVGIWGVNIPIGWGFAIVNFVWWIGIGHAGTLISAILLLLHQHWRNAINRFAEAMTLFAVACAGMFPILHLGRPWVFYWLFPVPNTMGVWPQFRSPLIWDVFAVSTYATISFLYWYVGLIPDLASMRDKAKSVLVRRIYGILAMGWRGASRHWHRYETVYLLLAGLATPLVVSVHSVVSFDFSVGIVPGWHSTIFPPYFVAGAIYSGFAMVLTLAIPVRKMYHLETLITKRHLDYMAKVMLATGLIVAYGYLMESFYAWYSGNPYERFMMMNRQFGPYGFVYWLLILCNIALPQLLWIPKVRANTLYLFVISIIVNIGMWLERFVIVVTSLHRDFLPSSWGMYYPTIWDWATFLGTIGVFLALMFLFVRLLPMISIFEIRQLLPVPGRNGSKAH
ncbi:MAG TPA: NrfD/PsrC family molybdoenzyme membrane anchor subunit [Bacteroidota bacterium]|nr:NrfD/PsrC family molybdoenzyme membrane anchor subunit [Bacteroidota bacterium]